MPFSPEKPMNFPVREIQVDNQLQAASNKTSLEFSDARRLQPTYCKHQQVSVESRFNVETRR